MRRILFWLITSVGVTLIAFGQTVTIDNFDRPRPDTLYATSFEAPTKITLSQDIADKKEGVGSLVMWNVLAGHLHSYGTYSQVGWTSDAQTLDWGSSESLSVWIKVTKPPTIPAQMKFRFQVTDNPGGTKETWIYQNESILSYQHDWVNLKMPLKERVSDGTTAPDSTGFVISPANWGFSTNDKHFNTNKIGSWYLTPLPTSQADDSIEIKFDNLTRVGTRPVPVVFFNGAAFDASVNGDAWGWGGSSVTVEKGKGPVGGSPNAINWTQGDQWGGGWTGWGVTLFPQNMAGGWLTDTLQFKMKSDTGTGKIRVQLEDGTQGGKRGVNFDPINDNTWHTYKAALKNFIYPPGEDSTKKGACDSTKITTFGIMAEATGKVGKVVYLTEIWTGHPTIDVTPPVAPTGVDVIGGSYANVVLWTDVPSEAGAKYNVYYSTKKFTSIDSTIGDVPPLNLPVGTGAATHLLRSPVTDQNVTYYYGVTATDAAGNAGPVAVTAASVTTKAQGVPVISWGAPTNFAADGSLSEWAGIQPIRLNAFGANPPAHVSSNGKLRDSLDLNVKVYLAMDANNLYIAYDVIDDTVYVDTTDGNTWNQDSPDLNIGLYDWVGPHHAGYKRGATPDYMLRFSLNRLNDDHSGKILMYPGANYIWKKKTLTSGYIVEAKIPFTTFAAISSGDQVFVPKQGMRIPIDFSINDRDGLSGRKAILSYSNLNNDNSWQNMFNWTYTWLGIPQGVRQDAVVAKTFELSQNYPNPFNPTTNIKFSIPQSGMVSLKVFDVLGREVMTVLNQFQEAGSYTATLDASKLATGMYVYKLESGSFSSVKKMMLIK
ncbi:MAG: sugar-binding protein [Bacteroidota bacterium]|nr:sugar-binding protein [Bacteroidota bacterium]